ncbi:MAG: CARDB domain-containing protein, partial [Bacteroidales bacterium]
NLTGNYSTHKYIWNSTDIFFQSYHGHYPTLPSSDYLINQWNYSGDDNPPVGNERLDINFWLFNGNPPVNQQEAELIIYDVDILPSIPDLIITPGSQTVSPGSVDAGSNITANASEKNIGTANAATGTVVGLWLSTTTPLNTNTATYLGSITGFQALNAGSNSPNYSTTVPIPSSTAAGNYYLFFWADGGNCSAGSDCSNCFGTVSESNECNNFVSVPLTVTCVAPGAVTVAGDGTFCNTATLTASGGSGGTIYWQGTTNGGTSTANPSTSQTVTSSGTYYFRAYNGCDWGTQGSATVIINVSPTANAGNDATICQTTTHTLSGAASNYSSILWSTSGDGTFSSTSSLSPVYTPGVSDIAAGTVTLTLTATAISPCTVSASDAKILSIQINPAANAGTDASVCEGSTHQLSGSAQNNSSLTWTTSGNGTFSSTSSLAAVYTPGTTDISNGMVTLTLTASAISPCATSASDTKILVIQKYPVANAGIDATISQGSLHQLSGSVLNNDNFTWSTSGDGSFSSITILNPLYTPGPNDNNTGSVNLTLTAAAISPCTVSVSDTKTLFIQNFSVQATANPNPICIGGTSQLFGNVVIGSGGAYTFSWTSIPAEFTSTVQNPIVTPNQTTQYFLVAHDGTLTSQDNVTLTVNNLATANAGADATICQTATHQLSGSATYQANVLWSSSGNGTFSSTSSLTPVYTPGTTDVTNGSVTLTLTANAQTPCTVSASDAMILIIQKSPTTDAGTDATICQTGTHNLAGSAAFQSSILWTTTGNGTFSSTSSLTSVYTPGTTDITNGIVTLTLTALAISPCSISASDSKILVIQKSPTVYAGIDVTIPGELVPYCLTNAFANNHNGVVWSTTGNGSFNNNTMINTCYTPTQADIDLGTLILTLTATPISPCSLNINDDITITFEIGSGCQDAVAIAGLDISMCSANNFANITGIAQNYVSIEWISYGDGTFSNATV